MEATHAYIAKKTWEREILYENYSAPRINLVIDSLYYNKIALSKHSAPLVH